MFILILHNTDESEFFSNFRVDFSVHMEKLLGLFAVLERVLELLFDFAAHCFEFLAFVDFWHLFGKNVDAWFFEDKSWCLDLMFVDLMFLGEPGDDEFICPACDKEIVVNFLAREGFWFNHFSISEGKESPGKSSGEVSIEHHCEDL